MAVSHIYAKGLLPRRKEGGGGPTSDLRVANIGVPGLFAGPPASPLDENVKMKGDNSCMDSSRCSDGILRRTLEPFSLPNKE